MKKKWIIITIGILLFCAAAIFTALGIMSEKGYGISVGRLYFADIGIYLVEGDEAMFISDCSKEQELFTDFSVGDKVLVLHDGINQCYPPETGAYQVFLLEKGNVEDIFQNVDFGVVRNVHVGTSPIDRYTYLQENRKACDFAVQYICTNGYHEDVEYPVVEVVRSVEELDAYYEANKGKYCLDIADAKISFRNACQKYDAAYFEQQVLIMVLLEEGSGSIRHNVESVGMVDDEIMVINIETISPEEGTCDMAEWHILIEPEVGVKISEESDVKVFLDGENRSDKPIIAAYSKDYAGISMELPQHWEFETVVDEVSDEFCIEIWPLGYSEGKLSVKYYGNSFGVCGTGLEQKKIRIGNYEAWQGTYDNRTMWDFISFIGTPGDYVVINEGAEIWWETYGEEAMQILNTIVITENEISLYDYCNYSVPS